MVNKTKGILWVYKNPGESKFISWIMSPLLNGIPRTGSGITEEVKGVVDAARRAEYQINTPEDKMQELEMANRIIRIYPLCNVDKEKLGL